MMVPEDLCEPHWEMWFNYELTEEFLAHVPEEQRLHLLEE
jgi:hypothetical protein